jgi:hypothetical protein
LNKLAIGLASQMICLVCWSSPPLIRIVTQEPFGRGQSPPESEPADSSDVYVQQQAGVAGRKLAGQQFFCALKDQYVEAQNV